MVSSKNFRLQRKIGIFYQKSSPAAQNQLYFTKKFRLWHEIDCTLLWELLDFHYFSTKIQKFSDPRRIRLHNFIWAAPPDPCNNFSNVDLKDEVSLCYSASRKISIVTYI